MYSSQVLFDTDGMAPRRASLIHNSIFHGLTLIDPNDKLEIQSIETQINEPLDVPYIKRIAQNCATIDQQQDKLVDRKHMMISSCKPNSTTLDDPLLVPDKEYHNEDYVSLKQCLIKDNDKVTNFIDLKKVDPSLSFPIDDDPIIKESSPHIDSYLPKKHKETLFGNTMSDESSKSIYSDVMPDDVVLKLDRSPQLSKHQEIHKRYMQYREPENINHWIRNL